jgi:Transposase C of IS166 homeodomain
VDADQLQLLLSGNEPSIVAGAANENAAADGAGNDTKAGAPDKAARPRPNRNRGKLPVHLPRVDVVIDVESKICPCCDGSLHKIGETVKEMCMHSTSTTGVSGSAMADNQAAIARRADFQFHGSRSAILFAG